MVTGFLENKLPRGVIYQVRESTRAKRLQIKISELGQVHVVIPKHFDRSQIQPFLLKHESWIVDNLAKFKKRWQLVGHHAKRFPAQANFFAVQTVWQIEYQYATRGYYQVIENSPSGNKVLIFANEAEATELVLNQWLTEMGKLYLIAGLRAISERLRLPVNAITVRCQKTRWGSCSSKKNISLNRNLLFLRPPVVEYLFIHELCHTRVMNHSKAYWSLIEQYLPVYQSLDAELRQAVFQIPVWAVPAR